MIIHHKDILVDGYPYKVSLTKLIGKPIKDIQGVITNQLGGATFEMLYIIFEDDTRLMCEGEHDQPYLVEYGTDQPNFDDATLERLMKEADED